MAGLLYLGAGVGIGMIVLDILAPVFLMIGIQYGSASSAALLGNFEIAATTWIALLCSRSICRFVFSVCIVG